MNILYINACVRDGSRTDKVARRLLQNLGDYTEVNLEKKSGSIKPLNKERLAYRTAMIEQQDLDSDIFNDARQFADADVIVIAAPYWDLSFPALLKIYLENIYITGIVSKYGIDGMPQGLCKAKMLYYVTTAGGQYNKKYSYDYIADMSTNYFGIKETKLLAAEMMDVDGYDPERIMEDLYDEIDVMFR